MVKARKNYNFVIIYYRLASLHNLWVPALGQDKFVEYFIFRNPKDFHCWHIYKFWYKEWFMKIVITVRFWSTPIQRFTCVGPGFICYAELKAQLLCCVSFIKNIAVTKCIFLPTSVMAWSFMTPWCWCHMHVRSSPARHVGNADGWEISSTLVVQNVLLFCL
jgi:hypothetical protein